MFSSQKNYSILMGIKITNEEIIKVCKINYTRFSGLSFRFWLGHPTQWAKNDIFVHLFLMLIFKMVTSCLIIVK